MATDTPTVDAFSVQSDRSRLLWTALGALVALQLLAFWMLCSHQVRKAEARSAQARVERLAMNDCLQHVANSTIGGCATRMTQRPAAAVVPVELYTR